MKNTLLPLRMPLFAPTIVSCLLAACGGSSGDVVQDPAAGASVAAVQVQPANEAPIETLAQLAAPAATAPSATVPGNPVPSGTVRAVGPGKPYATPCKAFAAAVHGDTIEIDAAGTYSGDVCAIQRDNLTIRGVNGRPKIDAAGMNALGKGIWVVAGANTVIENVEMFGARVPDRNGAAIRLDGRHLTLRNSYLHENEMGILTNNDGVSHIVIENSEFAGNGFSDGYSHNVYIGHVASLVFRGNYSHDARVGHNLKTRAETNTIVYNRFSSSGAGEPSYEIDMPNAGLAYVIGNVIQQPAANQNASLISFGAEGATNARKELYVVNNTFINDARSGTFIVVGTGVTTPVLIQNNIFAGAGTITNQYGAIDRNNVKALTPAFTDRAAYDLRPAPGSPAINAGVPVVTPSGMSLLPQAEYRHVGGTAARPVNGQIDIGAYEAQ